MPVYRINEAGGVGLISPADLRPYEQPPEAWSLVENARMINGSAVSVNPWVEIVDTGDLTVHALDYYSFGGQEHIYAYTQDKILSVNAAGDVNTVSKDPLDSDPYPTNIWITDQLNSIPIATNNKDKPQCFYNNGAAIDELTVSQDFPDWGVGGTAENAICRIVRAYKNFIVALNIVDTAAYPNMVWWSDAAEPGLMPDNWDYNDTTSLSGRTVLGAEDGSIVGAEVLRDSLFIYTEFSTYRMDFVGGTFVMRFTKVFENQGAFGPRCIGKYAEKHFVITRSDIVVHDGQQQASVGDKKVRNTFFQVINEDDTNRVWVSPYLRLSEMMIGVPDGNNDFLSLNPWQWDDNVWSARAAPNSRYFRELPILQVSGADDTWDTGPDENWDDGQDNIWNATTSVGDLEAVVTSTDGFLYRYDSGDQVDDTLLERQDIALGLEQSSELAISVYPRVKGNSPIMIQMGASQTVEGTILWGPEATFTPDQDYKVNVRSKGRRHAIRFKGKGFDLQGYDVEFKGAGRR